jgi:hypothetical protein
MKNSIIDFIKINGDIALTALKNQIPGAKGDYEYHFPVKGIKESNILLVSGVSEEFIEAIGSLINDEILGFDICDPYVVMHDSGDIYNIPIVNSNKKSYKTLHWLPIIIKKGNKGAIISRINS